MLNKKVCVLVTGRQKMIKSNRARGHKILGRQYILKLINKKRGDGGGEGRWDERWVKNCPKLSDITYR